MLDSADLQSQFLFHPNVPDNMTHENSASGSPSRPSLLGKALSKDAGEINCIPSLGEQCIPHDLMSPPAEGGELTFSTKNH